MLAHNTDSKGNRKYNTHKLGTAWHTDSGSLQKEGPRAQRWHLSSLAKLPCDAFPDTSALLWQKRHHVYHFHWEIITLGVQKPFTNYAYLMRYVTTMILNTPCNSYEYPTHPHKKKNSSSQNTHSPIPPKRYMSLIAAHATLDRLIVYSTKTLADLENVRGWYVLLSIVCLKNRDACIYARDVRLSLQPIPPPPPFNQ